MGAVKTKNLFPGICLLLLIISEVFWFSANRQKSLAQEQLGEAQQQVADLQSQLEALTNSGAANETAEDIRLHAENQDLPRLRSQIQQLQEMEAQTEQSQADQQAQAEAQQQAIQQTITQERNACIANLRLIYAAKQAWALDKNKTDSDVPTEQDLLPYLKGGVFPVCPAGGIYTIGAVGVLPTCSIPGHVLPSQ
jgi:DNA repair exonuclease SbcCD ATPase subunit